MTDTAKGAGEIVEDLRDLHQWALKLGNESELGPLNTFKRMTATLIERVSKAEQALAQAHVDPIIGFVDEDLTRAVVAMRTELEKLRAENARLKAPVSDEELSLMSSTHNRVYWENSPLFKAGNLASRAAFAKLIASRLSAPQKEEPHATLRKD